MFHTHAPLPQGLFGRQHHEVSGCSDTFPEAGLWQIRRPRPTARGLWTTRKTGLGKLSKVAARNAAASPAAAVAVRAAAAASSQLAAASSFSKGGKHYKVSEGAFRPREMHFGLGSSFRAMLFCCLREPLQGGVSQAFA